LVVFFTFVSRQVGQMYLKIVYRGARTDQKVSRVRKAFLNIY
jgi:hypothetical protein